MRKLRIGLLPKIILAIVLGIGFGNLFSFPFIRIFVTFNALFSELLGFSIPLIILGLVTVAIADIGKGAGRMLLITVLIAYMATVLSGLFAYFAGNAFFPSLISPGTGMSDVTQSQGRQEVRKKKKGEETVGMYRSPLLCLFVGGFTSTGWRSICLPVFSRGSW